MPRPVFGPLLAISDALNYELIIAQTFLLQDDSGALNYDLIIAQIFLFQDVVGSTGLVQ